MAVREEAAGEVEEMAALSVMGSVSGCGICYYSRGFAHLKGAASSLSSCMCVVWPWRYSVVGTSFSSSAFLRWATTFSQ